MKGLKSKIITTILDETGIRLHPKDLQISTGDNMLSLKLWHYELIKKKFQSEKSLESDEFAEDLLTELFDELYDIREKIIEIKKEDLNSGLLTEITGKIVAILEASKVSPKLLKALDFEFTDHFGNRKNNVMVDWGYPTIGLRITDYETLDYFHPIDLHKEPLILDEKVISDEILKKIR